MLLGVNKYFHGKKKKDIKGFSISQKVMFPPAGNYKKT